MQWMVVLHLLYQLDCCPGRLWIEWWWTSEHVTFVYPCNKIVICHFECKFNVTVCNSLLSMYWIFPLQWMYWISLVQWMSFMRQMILTLSSGTTFLLLVYKTSICKMFLGCSASCTDQCELSSLDRISLNNVLSASAKLGYFEMVKHIHDRTKICWMKNIS